MARNSGNWLHADCRAKCNNRSNFINELAGKAPFRARVVARLWDEAVAVADSSRVSSDYWWANAGPVSVAGFLPARSRSNLPDSIIHCHWRMPVKSPLTVAALFLGCLMISAWPTSARPQQEPIPKTIAESVRGMLSYTEDQFLSIAEAMPAEKYSYIPNAPGGDFKGVRSFAEQVKHVACANYAFFNEIEGKAPPDSCEKGGPSPAKSKDELMKYLRDSFEYGNKVLATINEKNAMDRVDGRYGGPDTKLGIAVIAVCHITDHYGQIVYYLRLNGIVPPPTQQHGLAVR